MDKRELKPHIYLHDNPSNGMITIHVNLLLDLEDALEAMNGVHGQSVEGVININETPILDKLKGYLMNA